MHPGSDYWAAIAQVVPVVALAVVVEVRAIVANWNEETPRIYRVAQSTLWIVLLLGLAFVQMFTLQALRSEVVPTWWSSLAELAIAVGFVTLVVSPAVEVFVRGHAEFMASLAALHPIPRWRFWREGWRSARRIERLERRLADRRMRVYGMLARLRDVEQVAAAAENALSASQGPNLSAEEAAEIREKHQSLMAAREQISAIRSEIQTDVLELRVDVQEVEKLRESFLANRAQYKKLWSDYAAAEKSEWTSFFRRFGEASPPDGMGRGGLKQGVASDGGDDEPAGTAGS